MGEKKEDKKYKTFCFSITLVYRGSPCLPNGVRHSFDTPRSDLLTHMLMFSYTSLTALRKKKKKKTVLLNSMLVRALPLYKLIWIRVKNEAAKENENVSAKLYFVYSVLKRDKLQMGKKRGVIKKKKKMEESELNNFQILRIHVQEGACSSNASSSWSVLERLFISHLASAWQLDMVQGVPSRRTSFISLSLFIHMPENGIMGRSNWPHCYYQFDYFSKDSSYSCALFSKPFPKPLMT